MNYHIFLYLWIQFKNFYNYKDLPNVPDVMISYTGTIFNKEVCNTQGVLLH